MDIFAIINTMVVLFGIMLIGFVANKVGVMDASSNKKISQLIVMILSPCLVISSVFNISSEEDKSKIFVVLFFGIIIYIILPLLSKILILPFKLDKKDMATYRLLMIFANTSFIGYPLVSSIYGESAIFHMAILNLPFNVLLFTYGIRLVVSGNDNPPKFRIRELFHPGAVASVISLIIYFFNINLPPVFTEIIKTTGSATIPLSMIVIGSNLALIPVKEIFSDLKIYPFLLIKMLVIPIFIFLIMSIFVKDSFLLGLILITAALPCGSMNVMVITEYGGNVRFASSAVFLTTLASIVTIPAIVYFLL